MRSQYKILFRSLPICIFLCLCLTIIRPAQATETPKGPVILVVKGAISTSNSGDEMHYDRAMLEALGTITITTETPWTDGMTTFTGVLARDVLADAGATGSRVTAFALNDYSTEIPEQPHLSGPN